MNTVINLAMAKNPADRLQSATDLVDAFRHALQSPPAQSELDYSYEDVVTKPALEST